MGYLWDKLFVRSVIRENNLKFDPDIYLNEDRLFLIQYLLHCNFVSCCNNVVYFYRQRCGSVMNDTRYDKTISDKEMTVLNSFIRMETICRKYSDEVYYACVRKAYESALDLLNRVSSTDGQKKKCLKKFLWINGMTCIRNPKYRFPDKVKIMVRCILVGRYGR